jgi:DNA (cytosine-5)-methyltransferase 1
MMTAYYNEFKPEAAAMLRQLIKDGLIAPGEVDERSITEVTADDIKGFTQCHFFAGIGGWSVALRQAGWPDDRPVWTGSCPCQPFSSAGKQKGKEDERHLWPIWFNLISECRPSIVFGEQVSSAIPHGWLDGVYADMEAEGYAVGAAVLPACSVDAPHKRDRLWFMADQPSAGLQGQRGFIGDHGAEGWQEPLGHNTAAGFWHDPEWIICGDGKARRIPTIKPDVHRMADGLQPRSPYEYADSYAIVSIEKVKGHAALLHGLGNAIVPEVAARFIKASM